MRRVKLKTLNIGFIMKLEVLPISKKNFGIFLVTDMPNS